MIFRCSALLAAFAVFAVSQADPPQYTVVLLNPPGSTYGLGFGIGHGQQVGQALLVGTDISVQQPALWTGTAASVVNLLPPGYLSGVAEDTDGTHQYGAVYNGGEWARPAMWSGTAASFIDMSPSVSDGGWILRTDDIRQVGTNIISEVFHAGIWSGTPQSFIDLNPSGFNESQAMDIHGDVVVGYATTFVTGPFAFEWNLATNSTRNLHPAGYLGSAISGTDGQQHVGYANLLSSNSFIPHAALWDVSTGTFTDLNPVGSFTSTAQDVRNGVQVGTAHIGTDNHAVTWNSTPESIFDLHQFLPAGATGSEANAIDENGNIIGYAVIGFPQPVMWVPVQQTPPPYTFLGFFSPLNDPASPESTYKAGRTIPIKFSLQNSDGLFVISANCTISLDRLDGNNATPIDVSVFGKGANDGATFRLDQESAQYMFNLDTKNLEPGRYCVTATVADTGQTHSDTFTLTAQPGKGK